MLNEHTLTQLRALRLDGMVHALADGAVAASAATLSFDERLGMLVQHEIDWRDGKRVARLLKAAKLKDSSACIEDIDWRGSRGLDRGLIAELATCDWLRRGHNVLVTGATGGGKTRVACALAQRAARCGFSVCVRPSHLEGALGFVKDGAHLSGRWAPWSEVNGDGDGTAPSSSDKCWPSVRGRATRWPVWRWRTGSTPTSCRSGVARRAATVVARCVPMRRSSRALSVR